MRVVKGMVVAIDTVHVSQRRAIADAELQYELEKLFPDCNRTIQDIIKYKWSILNLLGEWADDVQGKVSEK
jgi:hypothetical protein